MAVPQWAMTVNGVRLGEGTYKWDDVEQDLLGWSGMRTADQDAPGAHGVISLNPDYLQKKLIDVSILVDAADEDAVAEAYRVLATAWTPTSGPIPAFFESPLGDYYRYGRPRECEPKVHEIHEGLITAHLRFEATDPLIYGAVVNIVGNLAGASGGKTYPKTYPYTYGTANLGGVTVNNTGNVATNRIVAIITAASGGLSNPTLELADTGQQLIFDLDLAAGDSLYVDFAAATLKLNGEESRASSIRYPDSEWFVVPPGEHQVRFSGEGNGTIAVAIRSASIF